MPTYRALALPLALLSVALVGCNSSGSSGARSPSTTTPPTTAPATASPRPPTSSPTGAAAPAQSAVPAENNPPGDIPDNLAFVPYSNAAGHYSFTHPEGWLQTGRGPKVLFTDKLNGVTVEPGTATSPPTVTSARAHDLPGLQRTQAAYELRAVKPASVPGGMGVLIVYRRNSTPDAVTGRQYRDEVERYELAKNGREVVMELFGPVGADNVDAYRTMVQSLRLS